MDISTSILVCLAAVAFWLLFTLLEKVILKKKMKDLNGQQGRGAPNGEQNNDRRYTGNHF